MMKLITFLLFGVLPLAGLAAMVKIQRAEYFAAQEEKAKRKARLAEFRSKSCRPESGVQGQHPPRAPRMHGD